MNKKELQYGDLDISLSELYEQMGYGETVPDEATVRETEAIVTEVKDFLKPRFCFLLFGGESRTIVLAMMNEIHFHDM